MYYISCVAVTWAESADKHGIAHEDALHAIGNAYFIDEEFDEPRIPGRVRPTFSSARHDSWVDRCWR